MKICKVGSIVIGEGRPNIILPVVERTREAILTEAVRANDFPCDIVEWRMDYYSKVTQFKTAAMLSYESIAVLKKPLLLTFRSRSEGGIRNMSEKDYFHLHRSILAFGCCDLIDLELFKEDTSLNELIGTAHTQDIKVVLSHHNFERTLSKEEILIYLFKMAYKQADICKIALMPHDSKDVLTLMEATLEAKEELSRPIISMSLGELGMISRIAREIFGSTADRDIRLC